MNGGVFRFGVFELEKPSGELRKSGVRVRIPGQPLTILSTLIECPGEVVSREYLRNRLWPDGVHVEYEHNLNKAMNRLRDVLGDSADSPRFIETLPGRGYRFLLPVTELLPERPLQPVRARVEPAVPRSRRPWIIAAVAVLAVGGIFVLLWPPISASPTHGFTAVPLTTLVGRETSPSLSPDGRRLVFVWDGEHSDNIDLYVMSVGDARPVRLTHQSAADYSPAWSPDGKWIAFLRDADPEHAGIFLISPDGAIERHIRTIKAPPTAYAAFTIPRRALTWSRDSRYLIVSDMGPRDTAYSLHRVAVQDGTESQVLSSSDMRRGDTAPAISHDGRHLAFIRGGVAQSGAAVCVAGLKAEVVIGKMPVCMHLQFPWIDSIAWSNNPSELVVSAAMTLDGSRAMLRVPIGAPDRAAVLTGAGSDGVEPDVGAGGRLVYSRVEPKRSSIWKLNLAASASRPERIDVSMTSNMDADISPDGRRIAFRSLRSGRPEIWVAAVDGSCMKRLSGLGAESYGNPRWSPDSRQIALHARVNDKVDIYIVNPDTGSFRRLTTGSEEDIMPTWSRDGNSIYFASNIGGHFEIRRQPVEGHGPTSMKPIRGSLAMESMDGRSLFIATDSRYPKLLEATPEGTARGELISSLASSTGFAVAATGVYYYAPPGPDGKTDLRFRDLASGGNRVVARIDQPVETGISLSADGHTLIFSQVESQEALLMLVEGFR